MFVQMVAGFRLASKFDNEFLRKNNWPSVVIAMAEGIALSLGILAAQYAWAFVGLSVTEVVTCSITVVIDGKINKVKILFPGVACFLIAVCLGSAVHSSNAADNKVKLYSLSDDVKQGEKQISTISDKKLEDGSGSSTKAKAGTADFLVELENRRSIKDSVYRFLGKACSLD